MMHFLRRRGYLFLLSILLLGALALAMLGSLLIISLGVAKNSSTVENSQKSLSLATTCAERALQGLRLNQAYESGEHIVMDDGECTVLSIGGYGNEDRSLCTEGRVGGTVRHLQIILQRILPSVQIYSWREIDHCTTAP